MTQLKHPHFKPDLFIEVDENEVEAHVAAGWLEVKPKRKSKSKDSDDNK